LCFPEWKGRSAAIRSIGSRVPSSSTSAFADAVRIAWVSVGGVGGQDLDGLGDVAVGSGGSDPESCRELGVRVTVTQVCEGEERLLAGAQAPRPGHPSTRGFTCLSAQLPILTGRLENTLCP
jgi:hypothetical protein